MYLYRTENEKYYLNVSECVEKDIFILLACDIWRMYTY